MGRLPQNVESLLQIGDLRIKIRAVPRGSRTYIELVEIMEQPKKKRTVFSTVSNSVDSYQIALIYQKVAVSQNDTSGVKKIISGVNLVSKN